MDTIFKSNSKPQKLATDRKFRVALTSYIFDLKIPVSSKPTYFYWIIN